MREREGSKVTKASDLTFLGVVLLAEGHGQLRHTRLQLREEWGWRQDP